MLKIMRDSVCIVAAIYTLLPSLSFAECKHVVVNMRDPETTQEGHMLLLCNAGLIDIPERQNVMFVSWNRGVLCTATKECNNIKGWTGTIEANAKVFLNAKLTLLPKILQGEGTFDLGTVNFNIAFKDIQAGCSELKRECVSF